MKKWVDYIWVWCGALIVNNQHQVLLLKRSNKCSWGNHGERSRPGWGVDFGETFQEAMIREVKEEVWIDVELFGDVEALNDIREENGIKKHRVTFGLFAKITNWKPQIMEPEKCDELKWFDLDNLPENIAHYTMSWIELYKEFINRK